MLFKKIYYIIIEYILYTIYKTLSIFPFKSDAFCIFSKIFDVLYIIWTFILMLICRIWNKNHFLFLFAYTKGLDILKIYNCKYILLSVYSSSVYLLSV